MAEFFDDQGGSVLIQGMVNGRHDPHVEQDLDDFGGFHRHALGELPHGVGLADGDFPGDEFGWLFECVLGNHARLRLAAHSATAGEIVDIAAFQDKIVVDVDLLPAPLGWCLGPQAGLAFFRRFAGLATPAALSRSLGAAARVRLGGRLFRRCLGGPGLRFRCRLFRFRLVRVLFGFGGLVIRRGGRRFRCRIPGFRHRPGACVKGFLSLFGGGGLLLFDSAALDIGPLAAHLHIYRPAATVGPRGAQGAQRLAFERDLAWGGLFLLAAVALAQMHQEFGLVGVGDQMIRLGVGQARFPDLGKQLLHRHAYRAGKFTNTYFRHAIAPVDSGLPRLMRTRAPGRS